MWIILLIINIVFLGMVLGLSKGLRYYERRTEDEIDKVHKMVEFYDVLVRWLELKQEHKLIKEYFDENEYNSVAIYGMKEIGVLFLEELKQEEIDVLYAIDKNAEDIETSVPVFKPSKEMPEVDVIVVTAPHYFDEIYNNLMELTDAEIISIEDVLWGI